MLLGTVLLWALNARSRGTSLTHGFQPLAYATIRYAAATSSSGASPTRASAASGSRLRDMRLVLLAALFIFVQPALLRLRGRQDLGLDGRAVPRDDADLRRRARARRSGSSGWAAASGAALVSFVGVGFVASGSGGFSRRPHRRRARARARPRRGPRTRSLITPLMRRYSPFRISSLVLRSAGSRSRSSASRSSPSRTSRLRR